MGSSSRIGRGRDAKYARMLLMHEHDGLSEGCRSTGARRWYDTDSAWERDQEEKVREKGRTGGLTSMSRTCVYDPAVLLTIRVRKSATLLRRRRRLMTSYCAFLGWRLSRVDAYGVPIPPGVSTHVLQLQLFNMVSAASTSCPNFAYHLSVFDHICVECDPSDLGRNEVRNFSLLSSWNMRSPGLQKNDHKDEPSCMRQGCYHCSERASFGA